MNIFKKVKTEKLNFFCLLFEGAFNILGMNLLGMTTIVPIFLQSYGANMKIIGFVSALTISLPMIIPLFVGNLVTGTKSKKNFIIRVNSFSRTSILIMVPILLFNLNSKIVIWTFIAVISFFFIGQAASGLAWMDVFARTISIEKRGKLLGILQIIAGFASVVASLFIKAILDNVTMSSNLKYAIILGLPGTLFIFTLFAMLPLREDLKGICLNKAKNLRDYVKSLSVCIKNKSFKLMTMTVMAGTVASTGISFMFLFAKNDLHLHTNQISNMIVIQTIGIIVGGALWGKICVKFGSRHVIRLSEILAIFIPILSLLCFLIKNPFLVMYTITFLIGIKNAGMIGYMNYLIEVTEENLRVYSMVVRSTLTFPLAFLNLFAGILVDKAGMAPLFFLQIMASAITVIFSFTLKSKKIL